MCDDQNLKPSAAIKLHWDCIKQRLEGEAQENTKNWFVETLSRVAKKPQAVLGMAILGTLGAASLLPLVPLIAPGIGTSAAAGVIATWAAGLGSNALASWLDEAGKQLSTLKHDDKKIMLDHLQEAATKLQSLVENEEHLQTSLIQHLENSGIFEIAESELNKIAAHSAEAFNDSYSIQFDGLRILPRENSKRKEVELLSLSDREKALRELLEFRENAISKQLTHLSEQINELKTKPNHEKFQFNKYLISKHAYCLCRLGRTKQKQHEQKQNEEIQISSAYKYRNLYKAALELTGNDLNSNVNDPSISYLRGLAQEGLESYEEALVNYEKTLKDDNYATYLNLSLSLSKGKEDWKCEILSRCHACLFGEGKRLFKERKYKKSLEKYDEILRIHPDFRLENLDFDRHLSDALCNHWLYLVKSWICCSVHDKDKRELCIESVRNRWSEVPEALKIFRIKPESRQQLPQKLCDFLVKISSERETGFGQKEVLEVAEIISNNTISNFDVAQLEQIINQVDSILFKFKRSNPGGGRPLYATSNPDGQTPEQSTHKSYSRPTQHF